MKCEYNYHEKTYSSITSAWALLYFHMLTYKDTLNTPLTCLTEKISVQQNHNNGQGTPEQSKQTTQDGQRMFLPAKATPWSYGHKRHVCLRVFLLWVGAGYGVRDL